MMKYYDTLKPYTNAVFAALVYLLSMLLLFSPFVALL